MDPKNYFNVSEKLRASGKYEDKNHFKQMIKTMIKTMNFIIIIGLHYCNVHSSDEAL